MVSSGEPSTACSAVHFARKNRVRWTAVALRALKKTNRFDPGALRRLQQPDRRQAVQFLDRVRRLVTDRGGQVDHRVDAPHRLPQHVRIGELPQVAHRDLHVDPVVPELAWFADQTPDLLPCGEQPGQETGADGTGGTGEEDHQGEVYCDPGTGRRSAWDPLWLA